jgi:hypothetical protein
MGILVICKTHPLHLSALGSGSTYVYGYCDATYKEGMSEDETVNFVRNSESTYPSRLAGIWNVVTDITDQPFRLPWLETVRQAVASECA